MTEICLLCALAICCQGVQERLHQPPKTKAIRMVASWYGSESQGRKMACGEKFDKELPIVAHRTLPIGTVLELTTAEDKTAPQNKEKKYKSKCKARKVRAVVKDRGPFKRGRDLDVSEVVARKLGFVDKGHTVLLAKVIKYGPRPD